MFRMMSRCQNKIFRNYVTVLRHVIAWRDRMRPDSAGIAWFTVKEVIAKMFRIRSRCQNQICRKCVTVLRHVIAWRDRMRPDSAKTVWFTVKSVMEENVWNQIYMSKLDSPKLRHTITTLQLQSITVIAWRDRLWPDFAKTVSFTVENVMAKVPVWFAAKSVMGKKGQN